MCLERLCCANGSSGMVMSFCIYSENKNIMKPLFYSNTAELLSIVSMYLIFYFIYLSIFVVEVVYLEAVIILVIES